jgi:hypothetical protein
MKLNKKTDEKIESKKKTREQVKSVAWVLKHKKGIPNSPERELLLRDAPRIRLCGKKKRKSEWRRHEPRWHPYCDHPCCAWCQAERAEQNKLALIAQFTGYDPELLYIVTLSPGPGNVRGPELAAAMKKMDDAFDRLCRLVDWKKEVKRCGGPQHRSWEPQSKTHDLGFRVHNQLICLVKTKKPRWRQIKECFRRILGLPKGTPEDSHIVLTTHNPMAIAELHKEQVQILRRDTVTWQVSAFQPEMDPRGLGYAAIVASDMFGIASTMDAPTQLLLERQRAYGAKEKLSVAEQADLDEINAQLNRLGFRFFHPDDEYSRYLRLRNDALTARFKEREPAALAEQAVAMSREDREALATRLVGELVSEDEQSEGQG